MHLRSLRLRLPRPPRFRRRYRIDYGGLRSRLLIVPGTGLVAIGVLMLVALAAFRPAPRERAGVVGAPPPAPAPAALTVTPRAQFLPAVAQSAAGHPDVTTVAEVRSGTLWLDAWRDGDAPPQTPRPGFRIPIDSAAVDPGQFQALVPESYGPTVARLAEGGALLSRTGAWLRGIQATGHLQFGGVSVPVLGVVDDYLLRDHEMVVSHATGGALGLTRPRYLLVGLTRLDAGAAVEAALRTPVPPEIFMRVRGPEGSGASSGPSPLLPLARFKATFGEFSAVTGAGLGITIDPSWIDTYTELATIPLLGGEVFRCHKKVLPQIRAAFAEVERAGLAGLVRPGDFGGCFSPRFIRSGKDAGLSRHAFGAAFDFNVSTNLYGHPPTMDGRLVEIMERHGFSWGGRWAFPDGMHFEFVAEVPVG